jgi:hypothetical protein
MRSYHVALGVLTTVTEGFYLLKYNAWQSADVSRLFAYIFRVEQEAQQSTFSAFTCFGGDFLLCLFFCPDDVGDMLF